MDQHTKYRINYNLLKDILLFLFCLHLIHKNAIILDTISSSFFPSTPKELWCFACNSVKITCLHDCCPEHCNTCDRIKAIVMARRGHYDYDISSTRTRNSGAASILKIK